MANSIDDLETIRAACKKMMKELAPLIIMAEKLDDPRVVSRLQSAQSKLLFAKIATHELLRDQWVDIVYDEGECSGQSFCADCPC